MRSVERWKRVLHLYVMSVALVNELYMWYMRPAKPQISLQSVLALPMGDSLKTRYMYVIDANAKLD